jgi:DNA-binding XRE family transcriptional regulator
MVISTHLPPPVMIDSTAARQCVDAHIVLDLGLIQNGSRAFYVITGEQIRAARGLLGWSQSELAKRAELSLPTVKRVEAGTGPRVKARRRIQQALERGGAQFIAENGGGPGVRLQKRSRPRAPKK